MVGRTVLLGAGASREANIPVTTELLEQLFELVEQNRSKLVAVGEALRVALAGLRFGNPLGPVDIEELYQTLRMLAERASSPLSPFVGAWNDAIARVDRARAKNAATLTSNALTEEIARVLDEAASMAEMGRGRGVRVALPKFSTALQDAFAGLQGGSTSVFESAADLVAKFVFDKCHVPDQRAPEVGYLVPLLESTRHTPIWLATLNYDNTIELAASTAGIRIDRGFEQNTRLVGFDPSSPLTLAKLHGSIDWTQTEVGGLVQTDARAWSRQKPSSVVFGAGNKLQVEGPYLDLLLAFKNRLTATSILEVCGYSFRDSHINYLIFSWLQADPKNSVIAIDPGRPEKLLENFKRTIVQSIRNSTWRESEPPRLDARWISERFSAKTLTTSQWIAQEFATPSS
jgi:SIR2-like domain